eukprot:g8253.t1
MFVTLEEDEDPKTEQEELVSVDGVALSCLTGLGVPYVKLALNVIPVLLQSTGAAPSGEETITVVTKKSNGELRTRSTNMTYAKYEALEAEFRALKDSEFDRMPQCWTSSVLDNVRVWDCETTATTCVRTDVTRAKNDPKAIAYESLKDGIVPLLMIIDATDLRTGQPMEMGPGGSADYDWESGKCQIAVEGLYDAGGNEICNADKPTTPTFTEPMCAYNGMKEAHNKLNSLMDKMSKGKMKNDPTEVTAITSTDNWFACVNLVKKMQKEGTVEKSRETASCILSYPDTCGKSTREFCESNPSNEWCNDPCCNWEKSRTMCCAPTKRTFQARVYEVLPDEVAKRCANDPSISKSEASAFLASAIVSAQSFVDASTKPEVCFEDFDERGKAIEKIRNAPKCCFEAIVDDGYSWRISKSIQFCEDDSDCFSGKCVDTGVNTPEKTTKDCFEAGEYEGKTKVCQLINGPSAAEPLGKCLLKLLSAYPKASRLVKNVFADGDKNDKGAKVGNGIFNLASWITPNWIEPKWEQSSMLQWVDKEMISENKWEKRLEGWRFENSFRRITDTFEDERGITFTACMVGKQAHALETISGICGAGDAPPSAEILGLISGCVETAKVNLLQDVEETVGNIKTSNIQVRADTLPSTSTESAITLCEESYIPGFGGEAKGRRLGSKGDTMNSADCYTVVKNTKGKLVGQLVGDCLEVSSAVTPFANPATLCLKLKDEIEINAKFTEYDFAVRTSSSSGTYDYASKEFSTSPSGDNICADILKNAVYCPISRVPTPESVTEDQGGETCNALNNIVDQVQEKKAAIKCKAGDSVSCKWMEPGSTSFYLGVGGIIVIIIGAIIFVQATYCAHKHRHVLKKHLTKKFFDSIDKDGNGTLDAGEIQIMLEHEFGASVSSTQVKRLMKKFGTKEMDFETYLKFVEYLKGVGTDNEGIEMKDILEKKVWKRKSMVELTVKDNGDREFVNPLGAHKPKRTRRVSRNSWELKNAAKRAEKIKSDAVKKSAPSNVAVEVPPAWEKLLDAASGNNYFHNLNTGETAWELPAGAKVRGATRKTKQFI